ncbi:GFA family protein [Ferrimonas kyonanensis]|uniref:GFA family protein n=1 Tax=Ferrimonas kyonanensis TaxID=364763 RepID=UPI0004085542|nr:GFA family protein [Ferrimonas kyonanensis]
MSLSPLEGGCQCGAIRYRTSAAPFASEYCHCGQCRKAVGAVAVAWMDFKRDQVHWLGPVPTEFASSQHVLRGFCPQCGTSLSFRDDRHPNFLTLSVGSLDDVNRVTPSYHIYTDDQPHWLHIDDDGPRFGRNRGAQ